MYITTYCLLLYKDTHAAITIRFQIGYVERRSQLQVSCSPNPKIHSKESYSLEIMHPAKKGSLN